MCWFVEGGGALLITVYKARPVQHTATHLPAGNMPPLAPGLKPDHVSESVGSVYARPDNGTKFLLSRTVRFAWPVLVTLVET